MNNLALVELVLQCISIGALAALLWRIRKFELFTQFRWLQVFVLLSLARWVGAFAIPRVSNAYAFYYFGTAILVWIVYFLVLREILVHLLGQWKGLSTAVGHAIWVAGGIALLVSAWLIWPEMAVQDAPFAGKQQSILLRSFFVLNRSVVSTLVMLLILLAAFITWYPLRIPRNVVVYWAGFTGLLLSQAFLLLIRNLGRSQWTRWLSIANTTFELGCLVMLCWQFRHVSEEKPVEIGRNWDPAQAEVLIQQLNRINSTLERPTRP